MTFKDLGLNTQLVQALDELNFVTPTPIQEEAIPFLLDNPQRDLIALAQTGTGKTASFSLPIINQIDVNDRSVQALVLCPTRELCLQIAQDLAAFTQNGKVKAVAVYGGAPISKQKKQLKKGAHIVVGTPGRTLDLIKQKALDVRNIQWLVLDEADEMLNMGFKDDLEAILRDTPQGKQNLLFSATMPKAMKGIVNDFMHQPHTIQVARQNIGASTVEHQVYMCKARDRYKTLQRLVDANPEIYGIIFCRTKRETQQVADELMQMGYNADTIHGDLNQNQRDAVMNNFKNRSLQLLVATDVAARGIDVDDLSHVINYQLPDDPEVYVHRSGRTGRAGKSGISMSIIHSREGRKIQEVEKMIGKAFEKKQIPSGDEICSAQFGHFLKTIKNHQPNGNLIDDYWNQIETEIGDISSDEIINRLLSLEISRFLNTYNNAKDLNVAADHRDDRNESRRDRGKNPRGNKKNRNWKGYELSAGSKQNMNPKRLIALINEQTDSNDILIGDIIIKNKTTYFEIDPKQAQRIEHAFEDLEHTHGFQFGQADRKPEPTERSKRGNRRGGNKRATSNSGGRNGKSRGRRRR